VTRSLDSFLLPDDNDRVRNFREMLRGPVGRKNAANMQGQEACEDFWQSDSSNLKYAKDYRRGMRSNKLTDEVFKEFSRPITNWGPRGETRLPPQFWPEFMALRTPRVMDQIDCYAMSCASEEPPRDALHNAYAWDISQNVHMASARRES